MDKQKRIMVAVSGASGMVYPHRLLETLPKEYDTIYLSGSDNASAIIQTELEISGIDKLIPEKEKDKFRLLDPGDMFSPPASGSHDYDGLVIIPCSMGVVGRIASGISNDLITRTADVCLKERRKLILVIRETPLSLIHLRNLTTLAEAGAIVMPAAPAFYNKPQSISDIVDFITDRVLRELGCDTKLMEGWGE